VAVTAIAAYLLIGSVTKSMEPSIEPIFVVKNATQNDVAMLRPIAKHGEEINIVNLQGKGSTRVGKAVENRVPEEVVV
jgi:hypothetical protein